MKYLITLISLAVFSSPAMARKSVDETLSVNPNSKVSISVIRGDVDIQSWDKSEVRVSGDLDGATKKFIFETDGDDTEIKVELDDGFFDRSWNSKDSDLTVYMPASCSLEAGGVSTDYDVEGIEGGISVNTVSGDIDADEIAKSLDLESVSGDISVTDSWGKMKLSSVSGDIRTDGKAEHFDVNTVSGDIEASIGLTELLDLASVSGDLDIKFELSDDGRVDAGTVSGDVTLIFGNDKVNARFDINTGPGGDIRNKITDDRSDETFIGSENIRFKSGNGNARIEIETMSGTIEVSH